LTVGPSVVFFSFCAAVRRFPNFAANRYTHRTEMAPALSLRKPETILREHGGQNGKDAFRLMISSVGLLRTCDIFSLRIC